MRKDDAAAMGEGHSLPAGTRAKEKPKVVQTLNAVDQSTYISDLLAMLWPETSDCLSDSHRPLSMVALPNRSHPKLIIPRHPRRVAAAALRNYKASATGAEKTTIRGIALAARLGLLDLLPTRLTIGYSDSTIDAHLSRLLDTHIRVGLYIGLPRAVQKPVLQAIDGRGRTIAFAKLAMNDLTRSLIRREAQTINLLRRAGLRAIGTPELLAHHTWRGAELIVQSAIEPGGSAQRLRQLLPAATKELARCCGSVSEPWISSSYRKRMYERTERVGQPQHAQLLRAGLDLLDDKVGGAALEFGSWHGDWAPWNMTTAGQTVVAWDWEHFESRVPVGFDAIHYDISQLILSGSSPAEAFRVVLKDRAGFLTGAVCSPHVRPTLVLLYALELASRYLQDGEDQVAGTPLSRIGSWLTPVLNDCRVAISCHD